jgi:hypothetical protein
MRHVGVHTHSALTFDDAATCLNMTASRLAGYDAEGFAPLYHPSHPLS